MSVPDTEPVRKHSRAGLFIPFILLLVAMVAWTGFWFWLRIQTADRMDETAEALRAAGYEVSWSERSIGGFPFRLNVTLTEPRIREPSGWALAAPRLESEAYIHGLGNWIFAAPEGLTFTRPVAGPVEVKGRVLRASLAGLDEAIPRFDFQGADLTFTPGAGAQPFSLSAAKLAEIHLRPAPEDQAGFFVEVKEGQARFSGLFANIAEDGEIALKWDSILTKASALRGADWPSAARAWADAGGTMQVQEAGLTAGEAVIGVRSGVLSVGDDGRLVGALETTLRQAPRALEAMGEGGVLPEETAETAAAVAAAREGADETAQATITFQAGRTTLGPVAIGPAPRVY